MLVGIVIATTQVGCNSEDQAKVVDCSAVRSGVKMAAASPGSEWTGELIARGVSLDDAIACAALNGLTRGQVARVLAWPQHRRDRDEKSWLFPVGEANGYLGPADATYLSVRFAPNTGRVTRASGPPGD
jgi:hypothetical protein